MDENSKELNTAYGTSNGLFGQTDRDSGEYHFRSGHTQQVYSNAHYIPAEESTVPPRYYRPAAAHETAERKTATGVNEAAAEQDTGKRKNKKSGGTGFFLVLLLCFLSAVLGGAVSGVLFVQYTESPETSFLRSVLGKNQASEGSDEERENNGSALTAEADSPADQLNADGELFTAAGLPEEEQERTPAEIYATACSQVVSITTDIVNVDRYGNQTPSSVSGSGFLISSDGYILTNYHVVEYAAESGISVGVTTYDGSVYVGTVVGREEDRDLAIVKIEKTGFTPAEFGNSDTIKVGDVIYAVGNPYGVLEFTMSVGHVSALNRLIATDEDEDNAGNMFQIDAAVFSGNSGGPVYNAKGEVIGIVSARYSSDGMEGIGFAIPINDAVEIAAELLDKGYVSGKASLSADFDQRYNMVYSRYYRLPEGAYVSSVVSGGAAEKAGLMSGDIIMTIGQYSIGEYSDVASALRHYKAGDTAELTFYRGGVIYAASLTFDEYIPEPADNSSIAAYATKYA